MKRIILGITTLLALSCNENTETKFSLNGTTNGIENGTILYLDVDNKTIDSTKAENNTFVFNSKLPDYPLQVVIRKKDFSQYRFLWVENKPMTFDATSTSFRNATITGSEPETLRQSLYRKLDTIPRPWINYELDFVSNNPNSIVSSSILSTYATTIGKEKTIELFDKLSPENKSSKFGKEIARFIELNKSPKIGEQFVDFESENKNGDLKRLSKLKRKTVLLEFWASWCGPCRQENPNLVKTYEKFKPKGFEIFAVSLDQDKKSWLKAIEKDNLNWEHVSDLKGNKNEAVLIYGVNGIPDNFLIDENGEIIGRNLRGETLNEKLKEILQ